MNTRFARFSAFLIVVWPLAGSFVHAREGKKKEVLTIDQVLLELTKGHEEDRIHIELGRLASDVIGRKNLADDDKLFVVVIGEKCLIETNQLWSALGRKQLDLEGRRSLLEVFEKIVRCKRAMVERQRELLEWLQIFAKDNNDGPFTKAQKWNWMLHLAETEKYKKRKEFYADLHQRLHLAIKELQD